MPCPMRHQKRFLVRLRHRLTHVFCDKRGATAIEYGLIVSLIVISMIAGFNSVARVTTSMWNNVSETVRNNT